MNNVEKSEILSLSKDLGEFAIDSMLEDGLFKDIPLVGTGISFVKLLNSVSDRILLSKLIHFINELGLKDQDEVDEFKEKYFKDKDYAKFGSKILLVINQSDNVTKIKWLAKSLRLYVDRELTKEEFLRITSIINNAYVEDVQKISIFKHQNEILAHNDKVETYVLDHLFSIGLLESHGLDGGDYGGENGGTIYRLNKYGNLFNQKIIED